MIRRATHSVVTAYSFACMPFRFRRLMAASRGSGLIWTPIRAASQSSPLRKRTASPRFVHGERVRQKIAIGGRQNYTGWVILLGEDFTVLVWQRGNPDSQPNISHFSWIMKRLNSGPLKSSRTRRVALTIGHSTRSDARKGKRPLFHLNAKNGMNYRGQTRGVLE